jgi:FkbM family methyltransferase
MSVLGKLRGLVKPQYLFRPRQLARRVLLRLRRDDAVRATATLPWGMTIRCFRRDAIGLSILQLGVFDLPVSEALWRLADPGDLALDVGANIGHMTALLSARVGTDGRVTAFEPNPDVRAELEFNVDAWARQRGAGAIEISPLALSDHDGTGELLLPPSYVWNRGTAELVASTDTRPGERQTVRLAPLDTVLPSSARVGVMKLDVEGHELAVLAGARRALAERRIRDVVYEDHTRYPSEVARLLEGMGYTVFAVGSTFWGPRLSPPGREEPTWVWESPSYLATLDPDRARKRMAPRRWRVLL